MPGAPSMKLDALSDLLREARGASRRDALALVAAEDASQTITYGQLDDLCAALGGHLRGACGLVPGDVVSIVLPRRVSLAQVVGTLGAMAARLVAAPLNPTYHVEELEFFIGDAEAKVVVVEAANASAKSAWLAPPTRLRLRATAVGPSAAKCERQPPCDQSMRSRCHALRARSWSTPSAHGCSTARMPNHSSLTYVSGCAGEG